MKHLPALYIGKYDGLKVKELALSNTYYLLNSEDTLDKIKTDKLVPIAQCISDIINSLMNLPKEEFLI